MYLKDISIINFKNFEQFEAEFSPRFNCFLGNNGVGKTNLMDAVYYMSFTKSHFNAIDRHNIRHNADMFVIQGNYLRKQDDVKMHCGLKRHGKKQIKCNGKSYEKFSEHIGLLPLVFITPSDTDMIKSGSDLRRKYIDGVISQYDKTYLKQLLKYNRALEQRNALLKSINPKNPYDEDALLIWDERLHQTASYIYQERQKAVDALLPIFNHYYSEISGGREQVSIFYKSKLHDKSMKDLLVDSRKRDLILQHTGVGIHRDDLEFDLDGHPLKRTGSQGQEKSLIIALKLAQFEFIYKTTEVCPILLLDDIFDKLDALRIKQLVDLLSDDKYGQVFFSDTSETRLPDLLKQVEVDVRIFNIKANPNYEKTSPNPNHDFTDADIEQSDAERSG
ncbi:MAG: DNA replication/repair protein RecF [Bacteroidales bacterium]|jgi:DNA replication and repair protein RecF|nr:DNA replication/repair protein RecF [Bacteroidales bacterium]